MKENTMNLPVYLFLGFRLLEVNYFRKEDNALESFGFHIIDSHFNQKNEVYSMTIRFHLKFSGDEESYFIFNTAFNIIDIEWYNNQPENQIKGLFLSVVFPYIREKVFSLSHDYRNSVEIPTLDLRGLDLKDAVIFEKTK